MPIILTLLLLVLVLNLDVTPIGAQTCLHDGDVTQDGRITPADALAAFRHFLGLEELDTCTQDRADVLEPIDPDSDITPADALCIFQKFLGLPSCLDNAPPVAVADQVPALEDQVVDVPVLENDSDPNDDVLAVVQVTQGTKGAVTINMNNTVTYTPIRIRLIPISGNNQRGPLGEALLEPLVIRMENAFGTPLAGVRVTADILQGEAVFVSMTNEDLSQTETTDAGGEARFLLRVAPTAAEDVAIRIAVAETDMFAYTVCDNGEPQRCVTATVTILILPPDNAPPVAVDDGARTIVNLSLDQPEPVTVDVLSNDRDADSDPLSVIAITQGAVGEVVLNADQTVTYTPALHAVDMIDTFTYTVSDNDGATDTAVVTVDIRGEFRFLLPDAADDVATTPRNTPVTINVFANDFLADQIIEVTQGVRGTVVINADQTVTYTPVADVIGLDAFTYTIGTPDFPVSATVSVTVTPGTNQVPIVTNPGDQGTAEGEDVALQVVASDPDGGPLQYSVAGLPPDLSIERTTGLIFGMITPKAAESSPYLVTVMASDGAAATSTSFMWRVLDAVGVRFIVE